MAKQPTKLSGEQKVAVLVAVLGEETTQQMLQHLSKREVAKIARGVAALGAIEDSVGESVLEEYWMRALKAPLAQGGPDLARRILSQASISEELVDQLVQEPTNSDEALGPLLEAPPGLLAQALEDEHPQTTALVLLYLPPKRAAELLAALPEDKRSETVLRMANVRAVRDEILDEVAASVHERLTRSSKGSHEEEGLERTATVLSSMSRNDAKRLLEELEPDHPERVQELRDQLYTFDTIAGVDDRGMQELLRAVETSTVALALAGVEEEIADRFLKNLSERAGQRMREEMELKEKSSSAEREEAQKEILAAALRLEGEGKLNFGQAEADAAE